MIRARVAAALCSCALAGWSGALATGGPFPPLTGELTGELAVAKLAGAPPLSWKVVFKEGGHAGERLADLVVEAPGLMLRGEARMQTLSTGSWRFDEARIEVASWLPIVARALNLDLPGLEAEGEFVLSGAGEVRAGEPSGRVQLEWRDGALRDSTQGWAIEGIGLRGTLGRIPSIASDGPLTLGFREATGFGLTTRNGMVEFSIDADGTVRIARATSEFMEGRVELAPFEFKPGQPETSAEVRFDGVEVGQLAGLLPPVLTSAEGRVSGRMTLGWSAAGGLQPGNGRLQIDPGQAASLRLSAAPGFLTSRVPRRLSLLPDWLGPLARAFSPENPVYETLRAIEMGEMRLEVNSLDIGLLPEGDPAGRTARVVVTARPARADVVDSVRFEVNVFGPLVEVLRLGLEGRVDVHAR
ncbi:MAG: YdbH domain-containing protein [Opitutus sp.]